MSFILLNLLSSKVTLNFSFCFTVHTISTHINGNYYISKKHAPCNNLLKVQSIHLLKWYEKRMHLFFSIYLQHTFTITVSIFYHISMSNNVETFLFLIYFFLSQCVLHPPFLSLYRCYIANEKHTIGKCSCN